MDFPGVYKISIPQGNIITQEMVDQLRPGMSKRQVIFVMGTPLVRDPYHQDRWDYIYSFQPGGGERGQEKITVFFIDDQLVRFLRVFNKGKQKSPFPGPSSIKFIFLGFFKFSQKLITHITIISQKTFDIFGAVI